ncbi:hypothetical protein [Desulfoscipio gibsoniae]
MLNSSAVFAYKRFAFGVFLTAFIFASGCSTQTGNTITSGGNSPPIATSIVAPHGIETDTPTTANNVTLNCFIDADRENDFVVHGTFHLPGITPERQEINPERFQIVVPATETVREAMRRSVGQAISLFGKFDSTYGTGQGLFAPVSLEATSQEVMQAPSWIGWGIINNTQAGHLFECENGDALTDWVSTLSDVADTLGLPGDGNISDFLSSAEKSGEIVALKYKTNQVLSSWPLVNAGDVALSDMRSGSGQFGFVTSANALQNMLVRRTDVRESDVERFMVGAKGVSGANEGPHKEEPATVYGYAQKNASETIYVMGVEGDSFSQWMDIFRGKTSGYSVRWEASGVPDQLFNNDTSVYCWFSGTRVQDPETKQWYFCVSKFLTDARYSSIMEALSVLEK